MKDEKKDVVYKIFRLLRENVIKILMVLREKEKIRWKELQAETDIATATFNRALAALQEMHFISKDEGYYRLTWAGRLVTDGILLLGWRMADRPEAINGIIAEKVLARDIIMVCMMIIFVSLRIRGRLNIKELEEEIDKERDVIKRIIKEYEKEGYITIENGILIATEKFHEIAPEEIFSMQS